MKRAYRIARWPWRSHEFLEPLDLALRARPPDAEVGYQPGAKAPPEKKQRVVARDHADQRDRQRHRVLDDSAMHQEAARQQRDVLRYRQAHPAQYQDHQQSSVSEMLDVGRDQTRQASIPLSVMLAQYAADLFDRQSLVGELGGLQRFAGADRAMAAVLVAITVEQVLMADFLVASAVAMKLREQRRIFLARPRRPGAPPR